MNIHLSTIPFPSFSAAQPVGLPIARPPWTGLGKKLESMLRKACLEFSLLDPAEEKIGIALSGGKDSLALLFLLHAVVGRGLPNAKIVAFHVHGEFSCGASVQLPFIQAICKELGVELVLLASTKTRASLECYSCSRERRSLIFNAAKNHGVTTIAFGHHRDDAVQTTLMNLLHKGEFAGMLPKVPMQEYGVIIIRPLYYVSEEEIILFAKRYGFNRITCQCPIGQNSTRHDTKELLIHLEKVFPNARINIANAMQLYGSKKALTP